MRLLDAHITDFRNITDAHLTFSANLTALLGHNGQGKTNTLEALYLVGGLRPLRNVQRHVLLRTRCDSASVRVSVLRASTGLVHDLEVRLTARSRVLIKDRKPCPTTSFAGSLVTVAFTPDDLELPKGPPEARRRFLDRALFNLRPAYLEHVLRYQRALRDRNRLLLDQARDSALDAFDPVVAAEGAAIAMARHAYVEEIHPLVEEHFEAIARPCPSLRLAYRSTLTCGLLGRSTSEVSDAFLRDLRASRSLDRKRKKTTVGPHLDDLVLTLNSNPVRDHASQGQHRAIVLALKLAEIVHLARKLGEAPVLLLDDMSSELDRDRCRQLFGVINALRSQVIMTSTDGSITDLVETRDHALYSVQDGHIHRIHHVPRGPHNPHTLHDPDGPLNPYDLQESQESQESVAPQDPVVPHDSVELRDPQDPVKPHEPPAHREEQAAHASQAAQAPTTTRGSWLRRGSEHR